MDFAFSEEQQMLREQARSFISDRFGDERVAELAQSDSPFDPAAWKEMAGLGWIGLSLPEDKGGAGFGFIEEAVLFEELGRGLYPGPYFATVALALPALEDDDIIERVVAGDSVPTFALIDPAGGTGPEALNTKAEGSGDSWTLSGEERLIPDADAATDVLVLARTSDGMALFRVSADNVETSQTVDTTRRLGRLTLNQTPATLVADAARAPEIMQKVRLRAEAALALEAVGVAQRALELAIAYTSERKQFEKPIATYQAVSHQVANIYVDLELARSLAYWAAWCVAESDERVEVAVAAALSHASDAAVLACERSIQVHGGIGFTWEHILHRYYKRALWIKAFGPPATAQRAAIADFLIES